jgi:hypothetical protein
VLGNRILLGGIGIVLAGLLFLALPMWLRNVDHPLTAAAAVDVCSYMSDAVLGTLAQSPTDVARGVPGEPDDGKPACHVDLSPLERGEARGVWAMVTTERMLSTGGRPQRTDRFVEVWLKESAAAGNDVTPVEGPWRRAALIRDRLHPQRLSLLADDAGAVVWVNGRGIENAALVAFAAEITRALRSKRPASATR